MRFAFISIIVLFAATAAAGDSLESLRRMRIKQQGEENAIRMLIFKNVQQEGHCTAVQQTRERMREAGRGKGDSDEEIIINAGNEELNVTDNHGTINSDVNVQILKQNDRNPCP